MGFNHLTAKITFAKNPVARSETTEYTATITNPNVVWVFASIPACFGIGIAWDPLHDPLDASLLEQVPSTAPAFQHRTAQGEMPGLLLAPYTAYHFTGPISGGGSEDNLIVDNEVWVNVAVGFCSIGYTTLPGPTAILNVLSPPNSTGKSAPSG